MKLNKELIFSILVLLAVFIVWIIEMNNPSPPSEPYNIEYEYYYDEKYGGFEPYDGR